MKGIEKGRKKRNRLTLRGRFKEKQSVNGIAYPYFRWRSKSIHYLPNSKSGRGSFRHFYFLNITFHFYVYKVLRGNRKNLLLLYYRKGVIFCFVFVFLLYLRSQFIKLTIMLMKIVLKSLFLFITMIFSACGNGTSSKNNDSDNSISIVERIKNFRYDFQWVLLKYSDGTYGVEVNNSVILNNCENKVYIEGYGEDYAFKTQKGKDWFFYDLSGNHLFTIPNVDYAIVHQYMSDNTKKTYIFESKGILKEIEHERILYIEKMLQKLTKTIIVSCYVILRITQKKNC